MKWEWVLGAYELSVLTVHVHHFRDPHYLILTLHGSIFPPYFSDVETGAWKY